MLSVGKWQGVQLPSLQPTHFHAAPSYLRPPSSHSPQKSPLSSVLQIYGERSCRVGQFACEGAITTSPLQGAVHLQGSTSLAFVFLQDLINDICVDLPPAPPQPCAVENSLHAVLPSSSSPATSPLRNLIWEQLNICWKRNTHSFAVTCSDCRWSLWL